MQCPECGTHDTRVIETRTEPGNMIVRRRHECGNAHRFNTYQIHETTMRRVGLTTLQNKAAVSARGIAMRAAAWLTRTHALRLLAEGYTAESASQVIGVSPQRVRQLRKSFLEKSSSLRKNNINSS